MNKNKLDNILKAKKIIIPMYIIKFHKKLNITLEECLFLEYLINLNITIFDPERIGNDLDLSIKELMSIISSLKEKKLLLVDYKKDRNAEVINIQNFYDKLEEIIIDEFNKTDPNTLLFYVENKFKRKLDNTEINIVNNWISLKYQEDLIKEAIEEGINNQGYDIKYIDKILYNWNSQGLRNKDDVLNNKKLLENYNTDFDWMQDDEII